MKTAIECFVYDVAVPLPAPLFCYFVCANDPLKTFDTRFVVRRVTTGAHLCAGPPDRRGGGLREGGAKICFRNKRLRFAGECDSARHHHPACVGGDDVHVAIEPRYMFVHRQPR